MSVKLAVFAAKATASSSAASIASRARSSAFEAASMTALHRTRRGPLLRVNLLWLLLLLLAPLLLLQRLGGPPNFAAASEWETGGEPIKAP